MPSSEARSSSTYWEQREVRHDQDPFLARLANEGQDLGVAGLKHLQRPSSQGVRLLP